MNNWACQAREAAVKEAESVDILEHLKLWYDRHPKHDNVAPSVASQRTFLARVIEHIGSLESLVVRLREGNFTPDELQNLCHNLPPSDCRYFQAGCGAYQVKLFGENTTVAHLASLIELGSRDALGVDLGDEASTRLALFIVRSYQNIERYRNAQPGSGNSSGGGQTGPPASVVEPVSGVS